MTDKTDLLPCPFCGNEPAPYWSNLGCVTHGCPMQGLHITHEAWNRRAALAAPVQGDGLEVVAWQDADNPLYTTAEKRVLHDWANNGYPIVELCRLSDAQRAIAELQAKLDAVGAVTGEDEMLSDALADIATHDKK